MSSANSNGHPASATAGGGLSAAPASPSHKPRIPSTDGVELEAHLAEPAGAANTDHPAVIFLHGFPSGKVWADRIGADLPELADRVAEQMGMAALALRFRGCGESTGDFSLQGWVDDAVAAVDYLQRERQPDRMWIVGFGTGGAMAVVAAAERPVVSGVAVAGSPADFDDWADNPNRLLAHAKRVGAITGSSFPADMEAWRNELRTIRAMGSVEKLAPRPLLILHGADDELVPHFDPRALADRHGDAQLRMIQSGGHLLRHDPRAVAILLGWLGRQRVAVADDPA
jgi:putative redox protein